MKDLIYNGKNLQSFGYVIKRNPGYEVAERDIEFIDEKGDGAALIDNGGYKNVDRNYEVASFPYWAENKSSSQLARKFIEWLYSNYGNYRILRDSYNPGYFCYAIPKQPNLLEYKAKKHLDTTISFNRKPFWYSDIGQKEIVFEFAEPVAEAEIELLNPESIFSLPHINIEFNATGGTLTISKTGAVWTPFIVENLVQRIDIDSEKEDVNNGSVDMNENTIAEYFPTLLPGENTLYFSADNNLIEKITITPNWRRL